MVIDMLKRFFVHLFMSPLRLKSYVSTSSMQAITSAVAAAEKGRDGQIRVVIEPALHPRQILQNISSRERALDLFSQLRVWDTERNNGVLIYLCLADRQVEIVADRGFNHLVGPAEWELLCQKMEAEFRLGNFEAGTLAGIQAVGQILELHFGTTACANELPDSPVVL